MYTERRWKKKKKRKDSSAVSSLCREVRCRERVGVRITSKNREVTRFLYPVVWVGGAWWWCDRRDRSHGCQRAGIRTPRSHDLASSKSHGRPDLRRETKKYKKKSKIEIKNV
jgi:hypothetical protein